MRPTAANRAADREDWGLDERRARELVVEEGIARKCVQPDRDVRIPDDTSSPLESEIAGLARSLTPGGGLLVLGEDRRAIPSDLRGSRQGGRLSAPSTCRQRGFSAPSASRRHGELLRARSSPCLRNLKRAPRTAPSRTVCPRMCTSLDPERLHFPHFHVRAYKREGQATFQRPVRIDGCHGRALDQGRLAAVLASHSA